MKRTIISRKRPLFVILGISNIQLGLKYMRQLVLTLFIIINIILITISLNIDSTVNYLSYRIITVAFTLLLSIVFILENARKSILFIAILSLLIALVHLAIVIQSVYINVYTN